jgi:purine nucleosidase
MVTRTVTMTGVRPGDSKTRENPRLTHIDTDPGLDDALALLLAWGSPELAVVSVTTVAGNVGVEAATTNLLRLLAARAPVPPPAVGMGAAAPLGRRRLVTATDYHGGDGLGDLLDWPPVEIAAVRRDGVGLLLETVRRHGAALTLIALGPLTNVALALEADAAALGRVGRLVVMGGAVDVPGNVTPDAEFNVHVDPEAAQRIFSSELMIDLVPLDATRQAALTRTRLRGALGGIAGALAERVGRFTERGFTMDAATGAASMFLHDPLAVGVAFGDFVRWEPARIRVGDGGETRRIAGNPNCRVARLVDADAFIEFFLSRLCPASS